MYERYLTERRLYRLPDEARTAKGGLWADNEPVPPWECGEVVSNE